MIPFSIPWNEYERKKREREREKDMQNVLIYMEGLHIKYIRVTDRQGERERFGESETDGLLAFIKLKEQSFFLIVIDFKE